MSARIVDFEETGVMQVQGGRVYVSGIDILQRLDVLWGGRQQRATIHVTVDLNPTTVVEVGAPGTAPAGLEAPKAA